MEVFQTAQYVRLRSPLHGTYVRGAEDGCSVRLDARYKSHNAVWAVERHHSSGIDYIILRGAYGRYLGAPDALSSLFPCPWVADALSNLFRCPRVAAVQRDFEKLEMEAIMWQVIATREGAVELKCACGPFLCTGVSRNLSTAREWTVHAVPQTFDKPPLLAHNALLSCLWRCFLKREIRWVLADRSGAICEEDWGKFLFFGRDTSALQESLNKEASGFPMISMFVRAGCYGQLTPLCVNLPRSREPLYIAALWDTAANNRLVFPEVNTEVVDIEKAVIPPAGEGQGTTANTRPANKLCWR